MPYTVNNEIIGVYKLRSEQREYIHYRSLLEKQITEVKNKYLVKWITDN